MSQNTHWTSADIPNLTGKVAIVTGANSGIGYETAVELARKDASVIMTARTLEKGNAAVDALRRTVHEADVEVIVLDLADLASVRAFAEAFRQKYTRLDILCNNAGVMAIPYQTSADGFEMQFATNHLGHFALTGLLLDTLLNTPGARVVTVSSNLHRSGQIDFDTLDNATNYSPATAYSRSKIANLLFTYELQRRLERRQADVISVAAHPGYAATNLQFVGPQMMGSRLRASLMTLGNNLLAQNAAMGALPTLYAATASDVHGGDYFGPNGFMHMRGYPVKEQSSKDSHDSQLAARLWEVSEKMAMVHYGI
ncbi:MAG: oxidoreductase [Anaerolineae bacterium]